jgi:hypothetical protein
LAKSEKQPLENFLHDEKKKSGKNVFERKTVFLESLFGIETRVAR